MYTSGSTPLDTFASVLSKMGWCLHQVVEIQGGGYFFDPIAQYSL